MAFSIAYIVSKEDCDCAYHYYNDYENPNSIIETEHCILKRIFNAVKRCMNEMA